MKTAIVTGANRGIGLEIATRLAERPGYGVIATARRPDQATELHELAATTGRLTVETLDLTNPGSVAAFGERVANSTDRVDLLIHNAATIGYEALDQLTLEVLTGVFAANVFGPAVLTRTLRPQLQAGSLIVLLSSRLASIDAADGRMGYPYRMSKTALNMFGRQLSIQLRPDGIGVLLLRPGLVRTRLGGPEAPLDVETSVRGMLGVIDRFTMDLSGEFVGYDGKIVPW